MVSHAFNLSPWEMEAGDSEVQDYLWPHNNFERSKPAWDTTKQIDKQQQQQKQTELTHDFMLTDRFVYKENQ